MSRVWIGGFKPSPHRFRHPSGRRATRNEPIKWRRGIRILGVQGQRLTGTARLAAQASVRSALIKALGESKP